MTFRKIGGGEKPLACRSRIRKNQNNIICPTDATTNKIKISIHFCDERNEGGDYKSEG